jgi:hypothetical protein
MSKIRLSLVLCLSLMIGATTAFADKKPGKPAVPVSLQELQDRCINYQNYLEQVPPTNIKVICKDESYAWVDDAPGTIELKTPARKVTTSVLSDKWYVAEKVQTIETFQKPGQCHKYKEIKQTFAVERPISCGDIIKLTDLDSYCIGGIDKTKPSNPKLVLTEETGNKMDSCTGGVNPK